MTKSAHAPTREQVRSAWDHLAADFDEHVTPVNQLLAEAALDRADVVDRTILVDVAAGSGALAIPAARRGAEVVATDLSPAMIDRLRTRAATEGLEGIDAQVMDGTALDLDDDTVDVAASQHGVSVFADVAAGLAEMVRVTRAGGRVVVVAFGPIEQAEFLTFFFAALHAVAPGITGPPTDPPPPPFRLADPDLFADRLRTAGLVDVSVEQTTSELRCHGADHLWRMVTSSNPIMGQLLAGVDRATTRDARRVLAGMLRERAHDEGVATLRTAVNIGLGTVV